eukprot:COSAG01_NODE_2172_length_8232_cov_45.821222_1_plen_164_part_00
MPPPRDEGGAHGVPRCLPSPTMRAMVQDVAVRPLQPPHRLRRQRRRHRWGRLLLLLPSAAREGRCARRSPPRRSCSGSSSRRCVCVCTCVQARVHGLIPTSLFSPSVPRVTSVGGLLHGWVDTGRGGDRGPHGRTERGTGAGRHNRHRPLPRRPTLHAAVRRQ